MFLCLFDPGLISQFSMNLHEAELVSRASECQRNVSVCNEHSNQEELLKAVLVAGLYPNLIQVYVKSLSPAVFHQNRKSSSKAWMENTYIQLFIYLFIFFPKVKKGVVTKGGRFRPNCVSLRTFSGPVLLHRSSVNRFGHAPKCN